MRLFERGNLGSDIVSRQGMEMTVCRLCWKAARSSPATSRMQVDNLFVVVNRVPYQA